MLCLLKQMIYKFLFTYSVFVRRMYYFTAPPPMMLKLLPPETKVMYLRINSLEIFELNGMHKWYFNLNYFYPRIPFIIRQSE